MTISRHTKSLNVTVFCGSSEIVAQKYIEVAANLGEIIARKGFRLIYGGGYSGMMGAVAKSCLVNGGKVVSVIPKFLDSEKEPQDRGLTKITCTSMFERKSKLIEIGDLFIALPGGIGTIDEIFEVLALKQLEQSNKKVGILNSNSYYDLMILFLQKLKEENFLYKDLQMLFEVGETANELLAKLVK